MNDMILSKNNSTNSLPFTSKATFMFAGFFETFIKSA